MTNLNRCTQIFEEETNGLLLALEKRYQLVSPGEVMLEDLEAYRNSLPNR